ncbi:MAG: 16S rRNA (cytosine(1402)-N(4))-methyltransferase RsmH [Bacilli bacterium]|nr:16S rRNA (cytosine(1402)-N(4))-methyltransferase RsmH [Bacilli bacterium]
MKHYSVLKKESIEGLNLKENSIVVDATLGYGGHSKEILKSIPKGHLYAFDQDINAINYSKELLSEVSSNFTLIHSNFVNLKEKLNEIGINNFDAIIFDLGLSSPQIDEASRGFSFQSNAKLDMRMNQDERLSAHEVVNNYSLENLIDIFYLYGEEKLSKSIAKKIVDERPINTTLELVEVIKNAVGLKYFNLHHPERKIFQAIRIEVNHELDVLKKVIPDAINMLNAGGRMSVITFHSLEDKIVKKIFKDMSEINELVKGLPEIPEEYKPKIKLINKKVILPSQEELKNNSRSKSAKLRIIERI